MSGQQGERHSVGVLFVHGIGEQKQGDTLLRCADPLVEWLDGWTRGAAAERPSLTETHLAPEPGTPAHTVLRGDLQSAGRIDWLLAESWWSQTFRPPGPMAVAPWVWSVGKRMARRQMQRFFTGHERSIRQIDIAVRRSATPLYRWLLYIGLLPFLLTFFLVGPFFGWLALAVIRCAAFAGTLALVPLSVIPPLRPVVRRAQLVVTNGVGDSWVLKCSPTSLDAMVSRVEADLAWLEERADVVAVVAHSQGAVVAHRAIARRRPEKVRLVVTYGAALRLHYQEDAERVGRTDPLWWPDLAPNGRVAWSDYYAEWDPVAAGPIWKRRLPNRHSDPITNANSILADHSGYWQNWEQFVAGVAEELAHLDEVRIEALTERDADALRLARLRRGERVVLLTVLRWLYVAAAGTVTALLLPGPLMDIGKWCVGALEETLFFLLGGLGTRIGNELDGRGAYYVFGALAVPAAVALLYRVLAVGSWNRWSKKAKSRLLERDVAGREMLDRTLFSLSWLVIPAGLFAVWSLTDPDAWIASFFRELGTSYMGPSFEVVAWFYFGLIFLQMWILLLFSGAASLHRPPRPLRDTSQVREGRDKHYALFDHRGADALAFARIRVTRIGLEGARFRVPVIHAPAAEWLEVEVLEAASERSRGRPPRYATGERVTLRQGVGELSQWDEYVSYAGHRARAASPREPSPSSGPGIPRLRGARGTVGALASRVTRRREGVAGMRSRTTPGRSEARQE